MGRAAAWTIGILALLALAAVAVLAGGAWLSLDRERRHTAATSALPLAGGTSADGLVRVRARGLTFRARRAGTANEGPAVVLLHGFPETSAMWLPLLEAAEEGGYRALAFDQRGYSPGARPTAIADYTLSETVADVIAVADAVGFERFHLVGHDWGAIVGWSAVVLHPERVRSWTALSLPHPGTFLETLAAEPPAYIRFFQLPWLPERALAFRHLAWLRRAAWGGMPAALQAEYRAVFAEPGALAAGLAWYRAIDGSVASVPARDLSVERPVLFIRGKRDWPFGPDARERQRALVRAPYEVLELDTGHWLMQEATGPVVAATLAHWRRSDADPASPR